MTENNKGTLFTRTRKATAKDVDTGKQAGTFRMDEDGNIRTGNPSAHWLPEVKFTSISNMICLDISRWMN